jgi:hypothetical protein
MEGDDVPEQPEPSEVGHGDVLVKVTLRDVHRLREPGGDEGEPRDRHTAVYGHHYRVEHYSGADQALPVGKSPSRAPVGGTPPDYP